MSRDATKALYDVHSWASFIVGIALLIVCVSGAVAVFNPEIDMWANPSLSVEETGPVRIDPDEALARLSEETGVDPAEIDFVYLPGNIHGLYGISAPSEPGDDRIVYLNAYSGEMTAPRANHVYNFLRHLHVRLLIDRNGRLVVGLVGVAMMVSVITGVLIYKHIFRDFFRMRWRRTGNTRLTLADFHRLIGVWALIFHFLIGATGAWLGLESEAISAVSKVSDLKEASETAGAEPEEVESTRKQPLRLSAAVAATRAKIAHFVPTYASIEDVGGGWEITVRGNLPGLIQHGSAFAKFDPSGTLVETYDVREQSGWARFRYALEPLHYGYYGGVWLKICYLLLGLLPAVLSITGALIWFERRKREVPIRRKAAAEPEPGPAE